jgi:hypothetical protein
MIPYTRGRISLTHWSQGGSQETPYKGGRVSPFLPFRQSFGYGMTAAALWAALAQFHATRLAMNSIRMFAGNSPLRRKMQEE